MPYGYTGQSYPIERPCYLGVVNSPLRKVTVIEKWSPFEISKFEGSMSVFGKQFHVASKIVKSKTTRECIEFYYVWKKTDNYKIWKRGFETIIGEDGFAAGMCEGPGAIEANEDARK